MTDPLIGATTAVFVIKLSVALTEPVDVAWSTKDGTAKAGIDYQAANGVVTFLPGDTEKQIQVTVYGKPTTGPNKTFYIQLTPPTNAILGNSLVDCIITVVDEDGTAITTVVVAQGKQGLKGDPGLSAYEQAVLMGYEGTVEQWMDSIADASQAATRAEEAIAEVEANAAKAEAAAAAATFSGRIYPTPSAGVDPVTGVPNGAYFNVRSTDDDNFIDEYQNVSGTAVSTGKSYPSVLGVQLQEKAASTIFDASGRNQQQINDDQKQINTILNKTGTTETIAESVDATPFLQSLISAMPDGMTLDLLGKTFRVKKNTGFASDYPNGDQPCIVIKNKKNIKITNGKLLVKEHGQGCFDVINSTGIFYGVTIQGAGNFPPLDGNTGRAEKSVAGTGWFDETMYNAGDPRNNSVDTSGYSTGGFGGNFPQWGGGTASTWGIWNGGYIRNYGDGIFIMGNSDIQVENCDISSFNGSSITISEGKLTAFNNKIHDNYSYGIFGKSYAEGRDKVIESLAVFNNDIYNIGHPNSQKTDLLVDPGYGVATSNKLDIYTGGVRRYTILSNNFTNCKRKAIDAHHSYFFDARGNIIENCGFGVWVTILPTVTPPRATIITGNYIRNIQHSLQGRVCGISVSYTALIESVGKAFTGLVNISDNILEDVGLLKSIYDANKAQATISSYGILVLGIEEAIIKGNSLINSSDFMLDGGIVDGLNTAGRCPRSIITSNYIRGGMQYGILAIKDSTNSSNTKLLNSGIVSENNIDITPKHDTASAIGVYVGALTKVTGNTVVGNVGVIKYSGVNPSGATISFNHNVVSGSVSVFSTPDTLVLQQANFVISNTVDTRTIKLPDGYKIASLAFDVQELVSTATFKGLQWETSQSTDNEIKIKFFSVNNGVSTVIPIANLVSGRLRITVNLA